MLSFQPDYELLKEKDHCPLYFVLAHYTWLSAKTTSCIQGAATEPPGLMPFGAGLLFSPLPVALHSSQCSLHTVASKACTACNQGPLSAPPPALSPTITLVWPHWPHHCSLNKTNGTFLLQGLYTGCSLHLELSSPRQSSRLTFFKALLIAEPLTTSVHCNPIISLRLFH